MLKLNQKIKRNLNYFFNSLILVSIIFLTRCNVVYASINNWTEVSRTNAGIQYLNNDSFDYKRRGIVEVTTKYIKIDPNTSKQIEENIYIMEINCLTNQFKDISVNGKENSTAKWKKTNGDKLIDDVISDRCKNV